MHNIVMKGKKMEEFDFWVEMTITVKRRIPTSMTAKTREKSIGKNLGTVQSQGYWMMN
jgi:hypothetical protein